MGVRVTNPGTDGTTVVPAPSTQTASPGGVIGSTVTNQPGPAGRNAYELALSNGFVGTIDDWIESLEGQDAYEIAVEEGFVGTREQWLDSLKSTVPGPPGQDAVIPDIPDLTLIYENGLI
jgi:hypothetical protein